MSAHRKTTEADPMVGLTFRLPASMLAELEALADLLSDPPAIARASVADVTRALLRAGLDANKAKS